MVERIKQLLQAQQLTPTQFADLVGVARPIVSHVLSGRNKPSLEVVQRILAAFPALSMPWLLNGTGAMWAAGPAVDGAPVPVAAAVSVAPPAANGAASSPPVAEADRPYPLPEAEGVYAAGPERVAFYATAAALAPAATPAPAPVADFLPPPARPHPPVQRFEAGKGAAAAPKATVAPAEAEAAAPAPAIPPAIEAPTAPLVAPVSAASAVPVTPAAPASTLPVPGKAIRRIVIFYQDGSFSDFAPE